MNARTQNFVTNHVRHAPRGAVITAMALFALAPGMAQDPPRTAEITEPHTEEKFVNPPTAFLRLYVGPWLVTETHFSEAGNIVGGARGSEDIVWVAEQRGIQRKYVTGSESTHYQAHGLLTYNAEKKRYEGVWIDSASTAGFTRVEGTADEKSRTLNFTLERTTPDGQVLRYRQVEQFDTAETRVSTTYLLRGNSMVKQLEVTYRRSVPCPPSLRVIFDK